MNRSTRVLSAHFRSAQGYRSSSFHDFNHGDYWHRCSSSDACEARREALRAARRAAQLRAQEDRERAASAKAEALAADP